MSELLEEILKIEEESTNILKKAEESCKEIKKSYILKKEELKKNILNELEENLKEEEENENSLFLEEINKIDREKTKKIENLEKIFGENKNIWVENIVFNVIKQ